ncbi:MAG: zinc carboxypeptidase, partial [Winogradskyella sp.]|nr:zinc carboxypeptidase [Winogradskyella sp.]
MQRIALFFLLFFSLLFLQSQTDLSYYLPQNVEYDTNIPTPKSIIGHEVGEWHITHDKLVQYMRELAKVSDRITIEDRGQTFEGRPLILLTITSPTNHSNLDNIKQQHIEATETDNTSVSNRPIVVYQGFSIHGNEPSGSNAALALAYYLAAAEGSEIENLLNNTVILFDPSLNPDG